MCAAGMATQLQALPESTELCGACHPQWDTQEEKESPVACRPASTTGSGLDTQFQVLTFPGNLKGPWPPTL